MDLDELIVGNVYLSDRFNQDSKMYFCGVVNERPVFETFNSRHGVDMDGCVKSLGWKSRASGKYLGYLGFENCVVPCDNTSIDHLEIF